MRAGDQSLHETWLREDPGRTWDLIVSYYGDDPARFLADDVVRTASKGPKMPSLGDLLRTRVPELSAYDYVFLPDDDLLFPEGGISRLFRICRAHDLILCQPALSHDSFVGHAITLHRPAFRVRWTDWVEIMAPCFQRAALDACLPTFDENISGWGIDSLWPRILRHHPGRIGIVDAVQMTHTRPFGGPNYRHLREKRLDPVDELAALLDRHGLRASHAVCGGIGLDGRELPADDPVCVREAELTLPWRMPL